MTCNKTHKAGRKKTRASATRGWHKLSPSHTERKIMKSKCGKKCFLGPNMSYPICNRGTCKINKKGVQSAYNRSKQYHRSSISVKARKLLKKMK